MRRATDEKGATPLLLVAPDMVPPPERTRLREEARRRRASASRREREAPSMGPDGRVLCALANWWSAGGGTDEVVLRGPLPRRLHALLAAPVVPTHSSYLYYGPGDFLGLHRDHGTCQVTVLVALGGPAGTLRVHPELARLPEDELAALAARWDGHPPGGTAVDLGQGPLVLCGSEVPHHRPPHPHREELTVGAFCFRWRVAEALERMDT